MEIELLPTRFLTHKTRAQESPNTCLLYTSLEGAIIALACIIFSVYSASPPAIGVTSLSAVTIVWNYVGAVSYTHL